MLYKIYNNFYVPENMAIVVCGDFDPEEILQEIKNRVILERFDKKITRICEDEPEEIFEKKKVVQMEISRPIFMIGYKIKLSDDENIVKKDLAIEILSNIIFGSSSNLYKKLYEGGLILSEFEYDFEYARNYAHYIIQGSSDEPEKVINEIKNEVDFFLNQGIKEEDFNRIKKKVYGDLVKAYNDVQSIGNSVISNYFKNINIFDFFEEFDSLSKEYTERVLKEVFIENKKVISIVETKKD